MFNLRYDEIEAVSEELAFGGIHMLVIVVVNGIEGL
jgi:hypothetical protein